MLCVVRYFCATDGLKPALQRGKNGEEDAEVGYGYVVAVWTLEGRRKQFHGMAEAVAQRAAIIKRLDSKLSELGGRRDFALDEGSYNWGGGGKSRCRIFLCLPVGIGYWVGALVQGLRDLAKRKVHAKSKKKFQIKSKKSIYILDNSSAWLLVYAGRQL